MHHRRPVLATTVSALALSVAALFFGFMAAAAHAVELPAYSNFRAPTLTGSAGPDDSSAFSATLPNGRRLTPAGTSIVTGIAPLGSVLTPDGRYLIVSNDHQGGGACGPAAPPCGTFSGTTQNGAGATPPSYTLSVIKTNAGDGSPAVARVAFGAGSGANPAIALQTNGHQQIAESGQNETSLGSGTPATPDKIRSLWLGLALKPLTDTSAEVYAAGGPNNMVGAYRLDWTDPANVTMTLDGGTSLEADIPTSNDNANKGEAAPGGLVLDGNTLWVVNNDANSVQRLDVSNPAAPAAVGGPIPIGFFPYSGALSAGKLLVTDWGLAARTTNDHWRASGGSATGFGEGTLGVGGGLTPADSLFANPASDPDRSSAVTVIDPATGAVTGSIPLGRTIDGETTVGGTHPSAIVSGSGSLAYVADTNEDAIAVIDGATGSLVRKVALPPPGDLPDLGTFGLQPDALAYDRSSQRLYVAEAGLNSVAVLDASNPEDPSFLGRFPTGWYPSALSLTADGQTLYVTNEKGAGNFYGFGGANGTTAGFPGDATHPPQPPAGTRDSNFQFGSVERVDLGDVNLTTSTAQVAANTVAHSDPLREDPLREARAHIKHVFVILKENKSYDSYFGADSVLSARGADGYAPYAKWDQQVPNMKKLAEQFNAGDNFYADAEESDAGHQFALTGESSDYQQKTLISRGPRHVVNVKNQDPEDYPLTGYIFNNLARNGVSFRDYGDNLRISGYDDGQAADPCLDDPAQNSAGPGGTCSKTAYDPSDTSSPTFGLGGRYATTVPALSVLAGNLDTNYPGWNLRITDERRALEFAKDMGARINSDQVPAFTFIWLPQDHTGGLGLTPGTTCGGNCDKVDARFQVRDGDAATGQIVDYISHSRIWKSSAIFITEDDAQATADHVYAHRTFALVASPWVKHGQVVHTFGSTVSLTKTAEELLGVPPMSYGDELATDMADYFTDTPDFTPFDVAPGTPRLTESTHTQATHTQATHAGLRPGRVRVVGAPIRPQRAPAEARRIFRLMDRLPHGLDEATAANGRLSELYMDSVRLAKTSKHRNAAYRRAQARLYRQALAVVRKATAGGDG